MYSVVGLLPKLRRGVMRFIRLADLIAVNLIVSIVCVEATLRILGSFSISPLLTPPSASAEEVLQKYQGRPHGTFNDKRLNSLGFFDEEFSKRRVRGVRKIAALADSFGIGVVPYKANFLTILDDLLDERSPTDVYNFAVPAIGPTDQLYLYRTQVREFEPDLVLLCFFIGNDIEYREERSIFSVDSLYLPTLIRRLFSIRRYGLDLPLTDENQPTFSVEDFFRIELGRMQLAVRPLRSPAFSAIQKTYTYTFDVLARMHDEIGSKLHVALIPDEYQVNDRLFTAVAAYSKAPRLFDRDAPNRRIKRFLENNEIAYLDLLEPIRSAQRGGVTYKLRDTHWNVRGNLVAAEALAAWLSE